jgi:endogenous inhibitor of DNA gyrase (YacG/DUF329 family)
MADSTPRIVRCPTCNKSVKWAPSNPDRPFCSERCKLIDLGAWADEQHTIPGDVDADDNDVLSGDLEP